MRTFINFFLIAYALDAVISTLDDLITVLFGVHLLGPVRNLVGTAVFFLCIPVYLSLGIDSRLPKRVLLPPLLLALWAGFGCLPLPLLLDDDRLVLLGVSLLQLSLSVYAFLSVRRISGGHWLLQPEFFARPVFRLKNTALFATANIILVPLVCGLLLVSSVSLYLDDKTAGFMQMRADGLYLQEQTYTQDDQTIHLVAMIHIGNEEYYKELSEFLSKDNIVVLAEGVTDKTGLIKDFPSYSKFADLLGLDTQENMAFRGRFVEPEQLGDVPANAQEPVIVKADTDSRNLSEETLAFIRHVGELLNSDRPFAEKFNTYMDWYSENMTPEKEEAVMNEIIDERNNVLLAHLDEALRYYDTVVIPWGALHMPGLEEAILEKGFIPGESNSRLAVKYDRLFQS